MPRLDIISTDYRDAKAHIYGLAHNVCVNGKEQKALIAALQETETAALRDGAGGEYIISTLLGIITDGLFYGNWPWEREKLQGERK